MNMTNAEILSAAEACGMMLFGLGMDKAKFDFSILAFAKFIGKIERFKEREACAKACEEVGEHPSLEPRHCAESIRARGDQA